MGLTSEIMESKNKQALSDAYKRRQQVRERHKKESSALKEKHKKELKNIRNKTASLITLHEAGSNNVNTKSKE